MAITVATDPDYPVAGDVVTLSCTSTLGATEFVYELTSAPTASDLDVGLIRYPGASSVNTAQSLVNLGRNADYFTPDVPGEYAFTVYGFFRSDGYATYDGSPSSSSVLELIETGTTTVHAGSWDEIEILTTKGHGATLRLQVNNETVRAAELVRPTTELARIAALNSTVVSALAALEGVLVTSLGTALQTGANDLRTEYADHVASAVWHVAADTVNVVTYAQAKSQQAATTLVAHLRQLLTAHLASTVAHTNADGTSVPLIAPASSIDGATVQLYELRALYERHRVLNTGSTPPIHDTAGGDTTNTLTAALPLDAAIVAYRDAMAVAIAAAATGEAQGGWKLSTAFGFRRAQ